MKLLDRLLARARPVLPCENVYRAAVEAARTPAWYLSGGVPDTLDGRFDMVALMTSLVLLRLEAEAGDKSAEAQVMLVERFVDDMDGSVREMGIGDMVVSKHVGRMMGSLGGRLGAYRDALTGEAAEGDLRSALVRNLYRGAAPAESALDWAESKVRAIRDRLAATPFAAVVSGDVVLSA